MLISVVLTTLVVDFHYRGPKKSRAPEWFRNYVIVFLGKLSGFYHESVIYSQKEKEYCKIKNDYESQKHNLTYSKLDIDYLSAKYKPAYMKSKKDNNQYQNRKCKYAACIHFSD